MLANDQHEQLISVHQRLPTLHAIMEPGCPFVAMSEFVTVQQRHGEFKVAQFAIDRTGARCWCTAGTRKERVALFNVTHWKPR